MTVSSVLHDKNGRTYELLPPEGGWGYIVTLSISLFFSVTVVPICVFGMIFSSFLARVGDETYGTTLANGIFNTVLSSTGLAANHLLQKYSCRKVGLLGALLFSIGAISTAFVQNLMQLILTFGVLQGLGFGLLMPAGFTSFNGYFDKKKNVMMGLAQSLVVAITMAWPVFTKILLETYGWRGTQLIFGGLSLNAFVAMATLQPVKWHMKRSYERNVEMQAIPDNKTNGDAPSPDSEQPLLEHKQNPGHQAMQGHLHNILERRRPSIISIGSMAASVSNINKLGTQKKGTWQAIYEALDLSLFKDPVFVNIACGLSLSLTADLAFLSLLPMILKNANYTDSQSATVLTVYFGSDLICRLSQSALSAVMPVRNRYLFLAGSLLSAVFRTAFIMDDSFTWVVCTCAALGFLRCLIQTPLPLVVAEQYGARFSTAFTLYMVVCAVVSCVFAPLIGFVKEYTQSDKMVVHLLTAAYLMCGIPWTIELFCTRMNKRGKEVDQQ